MAEKKTAAKPETNGHKPPILIDLMQLEEPSMGLRLTAKETHPYRRWDLFSILEQQKIAKRWDAIAARQSEEFKDDDEAKEYSAEIRGVLASINEIPQARIAKLNDVQVVEACSGYFLVNGRRSSSRALLLAQMTGTTDTLLQTLLRSRSASTPAGPSPEAPTNG